MYCYAPDFDTTWLPKRNDFRKELFFICFSHRHTNTAQTGLWINGLIFLKEMIPY